MKLVKEIKDKIIKEYTDWYEHQYGDRSLKERQELGQFFTPPELTIKMIEKYDNLDGNILDPTVGAGGLLAGCIIAGADPNKCYGIEFDESILKVCKERLSKLGVPESNLILGDALNPDSYNI